MYWASKIPEKVSFPLPDLGSIFPFHYSKYSTYKD